MTKYCDLCENRCPLDALGCGKGRAAYGVEAALDEGEEERREEFLRAGMPREVDDERKGHHAPREFDKERHGHRQSREFGDEPHGHRQSREFGDDPFGHRPPHESGDDPFGHRPPHESGDDPFGHRPPHEFSDEPRGHRPPHEFDEETRGHRPPHEFDEEPHGHRPPRGPHAGPHEPRHRPRPDPEELLRRAESAGPLELFDLCHRELHRPDTGAARGQGRVLAILAAREEMSQRELQELLHVRPASMSELIAKLERKGLLARGRGEDRRANLLRITDAGREAAARAEESPDEELFSALDAQQREQFTAALRLLLADWLRRG